MFQDRIIILEQENKAWVDYIKSVQSKLKQIYPEINLGNSGPNRDGIDGVLGKLTRQAVRRFQLDNGGNGKGFPGEWTASKLGLKYVTKPDVIIDKPEDISKQNCGKFQIYPTLKDTLADVCAGKSILKTPAPDGCSGFVQEKTGKYQGNAWHAYLTKGIPGLSGFKNVFSNQQNLNTMAEIFQQINKQSTGLTQSGINSSGTFGKIKSLISGAIPSKDSFSNLKIGDVVGIYYPNSKHHGEAFFQAATGIGGKEGRTQVTPGLFFAVSEDGKNWRNWQLSDVGKNLMVRPSKKLLAGDHFGFNTHLGFVGAKKPNGEPIIVHNVSGTVHSTPLSKMSGEFNIIWARPA